MSNPHNVMPLFRETVMGLVDNRCFPVRQPNPERGDFPSVVYGIVGEDATLTAEGPVQHRSYLWYEIRAYRYREVLDLDQRILRALQQTGKLGVIRGHTDDFDDDLELILKTRTVSLR